MQLACFSLLKVRVKLRKSLLDLLFTELCIEQE